MKKPVLVIMAAGLGSRFGGNKQVTPVDDQGQLIIDYSIYDACRAGFGKVVFIIQPSMRESFHQAIGRRVEKKTEIAYAYQTLDRFFPQEMTLPAERVKPWGTAHAALCAYDEIDAPFSVINADDFLGRSSFEAICGFLKNDASPTVAGMIGYRLKNTLSENGTVARGVCDTDGNGFLTDINERVGIAACPEGGKYVSGDGREHLIPGETLVSMNLWGFDESFKDRLKENFRPWLEMNLEKNPEKCEYFLPYVPHLLISRGQISVRVLPTGEKWYGVTYREDLPAVKAAIASMKQAGMYPEKLWE